MDLTTLFIIALAIVGLITALVQVLKTTLQLATRYVPIVSIAVGILFGLLLQPLSDYNIYTMAVAGLIGGLAASGAFDLSKVVKGDKQ